MNALSARRLVAALLGIAVLALCWTGSAETHARPYVESGLKRALAAFAVARSVGSVISVVQASRVEVTPAGVGVELAPGEALQPINELIDRFATVMLFASVSFGIQTILLEIGASMLVSAIASIAAALWLAAYWRAPNSRAAERLRTFLIVLLLVRFAVPAFAIANEKIYDAFMASAQQQGMDLLGERQAAADLSAAPPKSNADDKGWVNRMIDKWRGAADRLEDVKDRVEDLVNRAKNWTDGAVKLMAIFVIQTAVLPLAFLWAFWRLLRLVTAPTVSTPKYLGHGLRQPLSASL